MQSAKYLIKYLAKSRLYDALRNFFNLNIILRIVIDLKVVNKMKNIMTRERRT